MGVYSGRYPEIRVDDLLTRASSEIENFAGRRCCDLSSAKVSVYKCEMDIILSGEAKVISERHILPFYSQGVCFRDANAWVEIPGRKDRIYLR